MDQTVDTERRTAFRHGVLLLLLSALLGFVAGSPVPHPAKWMVAHLSGLLTGILLIGFGALWNDLRLAPTTRKRALQLALIAAWISFVSNSYIAIVNLPGPASEPGRAPDAAWQMTVFFVLLAIVVPATLASFFLVWKGLRN